MYFIRRAVWLFFVVLLSGVSVEVAAEESSVPEAGLEDELIAPWRVQVDNAVRTRILVISAVTRNADGVLGVKAEYGWSYARPVPVDVVVARSAEGITLDFVTPTGARVDVLRRAPGLFEGTFVLRDGTLHSVRIERLSAVAAKAEIDAEKQAYSRATLIRPGQDVPEACAFFWGGWAGNWSAGGGALRLWVVSVDADCRVRYSFRRSNSADLPARFRSEQIRDGVLELPCSTGTCSFERHGDVLWSRYSDLHVLVNRPGGAVFERIR